MHSAAAASLTVKNFKITKERHVLHFCLSRQKQAKTHVNRSKHFSELKNPGQGRRGKIHIVPPLISFPSYTTVSPLLDGINKTIQFHWYMGSLVSIPPVSFKT